MAAIILKTSKHHRTSPKASYAASGHQYAVKTSIAIAILIAALFLLGAAIEHSNMVVNAIRDVWHSLHWFASLGGHFYGGVVVAIAAISLLTWLCCVSIDRAATLKVAEYRYLSNFFWLGLCAYMLLFLALTATATTYDSFEALNGYRKVAISAINAAFLLASFIWLVLICFFYILLTRTTNAIQIENS
jgi:hypothetical protein